MADTRISELDPASTLNGTEVSVVVQAGVTKNAPLSAVADWALKVYAWFRQSGAGAVSRTLQDKLRERVSVLDFGADPTGAADSLAAFNSAVAALGARGGTVHVPSGSYKVSGTINRPSKVFICGDGADASEIFCTANAPVIASNGSISGVISGGGVQEILLRASGYTNTNAHGISESWTNRSRHKNVRIHGARFGMFASNVWQVAWDTIDVDGAGADQNYIGFYMAEVDPANQNNAVRAVNCTAQDVAFCGWRLINFNGSKFTSCEGMGGAHGWYLGDPTTGNERVRWGHFVNCLADTTTSHGWRLEKGSALSFEQVQFANCWSGTSTGGCGWRVAGCSSLQITSPMVVASNQSSISISQSSRIVISSAQLLGYDGAAAAHPGIALVDSSYIEIGGASHIYSASAAAKAVVESGASDNNLVVGNFLQSGYTKVGANSRILRNNGAGGERRGSATIGAASTSVTVSHNMGHTPSIDEVRLTARDNMGAATKSWVSGMTATTFDINVNTAPGAAITIAWAIDPIGQ